MVEQAQDLDNDKEWILEIMAEFLQSPLWKNPIISFVEENCVIFENTEENRLDYTEVHSKFKRLVESKLEAYIQDLGISQSDFVMAQQRASKRIHKSLLQQILAVEDFMLFKQMMVNKNIQMNKEAMKQMQSKGKVVNHISNAVAQQSSSEESDEDDDGEEEQIRKAIEESKASAEAEEARRKQEESAAVEEAKRAAKAEEKAKIAADREAKALQKAEAAAAAQAQAQSQAQATAFSNSGLPNLGGGGAAASSLPQISSALPGIGHKPKSTGLALFDEIQIDANEPAEVQEEKSQRQALKQEKQDMIAQRNQKRQQETEVAQRARQAAQETEDQEAKAARIQRGLQALSLAPADDANAEKRKNIYKNIRQNLD